MQTFSPYLNEFLNYLFELDGPPVLGAKCACGLPGFYQCCECHQHHPSCPSCIVTTHRHCPFHRLRFWNGSYWERKTLAEVGLVVALGHHGAVCSEHDASKPPSDVVVTHINGIQRVRVIYCHCAGHPPHLTQLMRAELFPATVKHPASACTFEVLKRFHLLKIQSKIPAYEYFETLKRYTDNVLPMSVSVSTPEAVSVAC